MGLVGGKAGGRSRENWGWEIEIDDAKRKKAKKEDVFKGSVGSLEDS